MIVLYLDQAPCIKVSRFVWQPSLVKITNWKSQCVYMPDVESYDVEKWLNEVLCATALVKL